MKQVAWVACALLLLQVVSALKFGVLLGKRADPCTEDLWGEVQNFATVGGVTTGRNFRNCILAGRPTTGPQSHRTILLPAENPAYPNFIIADFSGRGFSALGAAFELVLGNPTADPAQYCTVTNVNGLATNPTATVTVSSDTDATVSIDLRTWASRAIELEDLPRPICANLPVHTGLNINTELDTTNQLNLVWTGLFSGAVYDCNANDRICSARDVESLDLPEVERAQLRARTTCCTSPPRAVRLSEGGAFGDEAVITLGSCINPTVQSCCGAVPVSLSTEKCCNSAIESVAFADGTCNCANNTDCAGNEFNCCRGTRFNEVLQGEDEDPLFFEGQCFNPVTHRCCDSGEAYDPGSLQCCPINGLQTLNLPCPCNNDAHCPFVSPEAEVRCCVQSSPNTLEQRRAETGGASLCSAFSNYPLGGAIPPQASRCLGVCYDSRFQICCNGVRCALGIEQCCNSTCCNRFTEGCFRSSGSNSRGFASNGREFGEIFSKCSSIEYLDEVKVFWFAVLPALLLAASLLSLALALVFVNKASARRSSFLERALIVLAVITFFLALPLYFSVVYKYGLVTAFAAIVAILTAGVRVRWLNVFAIVFLAIAVIFVVDPFYGNAWLTLTSDRIHYSPNNADILGTTDVRTSGVLHASNFLFADWEAQNVNPLLGRCVTFYNYFAIDRELYDFDRSDNREIHTFGYCSRAWIIGQIYIEGLIILFLIVTFIVAVLALIVRFRKLRFEPIELEIRDVAPGIVY
jgi:hypothetical protein